MSDLAGALYDEDRESDGYVSNATRLWGWRPGVLTAFFGVRSVLASEPGLSRRGQLRPATCGHPIGLAARRTGGSWS